jgi:hypothetical protein
LDRAKLVADPTAGGQLLRVHYPTGSSSPTASREEDAPEGGAKAYLRLSRPTARSC